MLISTSLLTIRGLIENWIGVMQNYYERYVFNNVPNAQLQLSLAGTLMELLVDLMGPVFQILSTRYGIKFVMVLGMILGVLGLELAGFTSQVNITMSLFQEQVGSIHASFLNILDLALVSDARDPFRYGRVVSVYCKRVS